MPCRPGLLPRLPSSHRHHRYIFEEKEGRDKAAKDPSKKKKAVAARLQVRAGEGGNVPHITGGLGSPGEPVVVAVPVRQRLRAQLTRICMMWLLQQTRHLVRQPCEELRP